MTPPKVNCAQDGHDWIIYDGTTGGDSWRVCYLCDETADL